MPAQKMRQAPAGKRTGRRSASPSEPSDALPAVVDLGMEVAEAVPSGLVVAGARAVGHGAMRAGALGLEVVGSVAEAGAEALSGAADVAGSAGESCAGCLTVVVLFPAMLAVVAAFVV